LIERPPRLLGVVYEHPKIVVCGGSEL